MPLFIAGSTMYSIIMEKLQFDFSISFLVKKACVKNTYIQHQVAEVLFNLKKFTHMDFIRKTGQFCSL